MYVHVHYVGYDVPVGGRGWRLWYGQSRGKASTLTDS